jgi:predicted nucleic acid-binding protein
LLAELEILPVDLQVAREHARIWAELAQRGEMIGPYDLLIAATALAYRVPLATLNDREFRKVKGLEVRALRPYLRA